MLKKLINYGYTDVESKFFEIYSCKQNINIPHTYENTAEYSKDLEV